MADLDQAGEAASAPGRRSPWSGSEARPTLARRLARAAGWGVAVLCAAAGAAIAVSVLWVSALRVLDPPTTWHMAAEARRLGGAAQTWVPLSAIAPDLRRALIAAEDARFCAHRGVDFQAVAEAIDDWRAGGRLRGASTITQQTAKNAFLWVERSSLRKALEFWFAALVDRLWPKARVLEVYANVAEFGEGVFGVEAAARAAFGRSAAELNLDQAARLAAVLPAPTVRSPLDGGPDAERRRARIVDGARTLAATGAAACVGA